MTDGVCRSPACKQSKDDFSFHLMIIFSTLQKKNAQNAMNRMLNVEKEEPFKFPHIF
jgi:hypothetical protein